MDIPNFGQLSNIGISSGAMQGIVSTFVWVVLISGLIISLVLVIRNKLKYKYIGEIIKRRQDGFEEGSQQGQFVSGKAGYFKTKTGKTVFRIKYGFAPWQKFELTKLPNPKYMIGNKVYYIQLNKDSFAQAKMDIDWEKGMTLEPVEDDLKYGAMLDMKERGLVLELTKINPTVVGFVVMAFIIVTGIIVFYFLGKA